MHKGSPGSYLPDGTQVVMITADPDQAARAPMGDAIVGDPVVAIEQLLLLVKPTASEIASQKKYVCLVPLWKRQNHRKTI